MSTLCININNTNTQHAIIRKRQVDASAYLPTRRLTDPLSGIKPVICAHLEKETDLEGLLEKTRELLDLCYSSQQETVDRLQKEEPFRQMQTTS